MGGCPAYIKEDGDMAIVKMTIIAAGEIERGL